MSKPTIGVFDSGIGGQSVVSAVETAMPDTKVIFKNDSAHMPYGNKTTDELFALSLPILKDLVSSNCQVIIIACNTVTTTIIDRLRKAITIPLIGMEPMVKPAAAATKSKIIAVCATPVTLRSARYQHLKDTYAKGIKVIEPDCSNWAAMIEDNELNTDQISQQINQVCESGADVIVLGCTHYHWIQAQVQESAAGRAEVIQPEGPVIERLKSVLASLEP